MIAQILELPEDPAELRPWLERRLFTTDLEALVAELELLHGSPTRPETLGETLGDNADAILDRGLAELNRSQLRTLLTQPHLLIELRDLVIAAGGSYWDAVPSPEAHIAAAYRVSRNWRTHGEPRKAKGYVRHLLGYAATMFATAAIVLVLVNPFREPGPKADGGWGFSRVAELAQLRNPKEVYAKLAELAEQWNAKPTPDAASLIKRLTEFRQGCAALQLSNDLPLPPEEVRWLKLRCGDWSSAVEAHLHDVESGKNIDQVKVEINATIGAMAQELRTRL